MSTKYKSITCHNEKDLKQAIEAITSLFDGTFKPFESYCDSWGVIVPNNHYETWNILLTKDNYQYK